MAFMTGATVRNLPRYNAIIDRSRMEREYKEKEAEAKKQKELSTQAAYEIYALSQSGLPPEKMKEGMVQIVQSFKEKGADGSVIPIALDMTKRFEQDRVSKKNEAYQDKIREREDLTWQQQLDQLNRQKSDNHILSTLQSGKAFDREGNPIPFNKDSLLGNLSYGARQQYDEGQRAQEKHNLDMKVGDARLKQLNSSAKGRPDKTPSTSDLKYIEQQALSSLGADLKAYGAEFFPDEKMVMIPTDANGNPTNMDVLKAIDRSGFTFRTGTPQKTENNWLSDDKYARPVYIGGFNPGGRSSSHEAPPRTSAEPGSNVQPGQAEPGNGQRKPLSAFGASTKPATVESQGKYGARPDGTEKGHGYFGEIKRPDGKVSTEMSVSVNIDGKDVLIPTMVPGLTPSEIESLFAAKDPKQIPESVMRKAIAHAKRRLSEGKSVFIEPGESLHMSPLSPIERTKELFKGNSENWHKMKPTAKTLIGNNL